MKKNEIIIDEILTEIREYESLYDRWIERCVKTEDRFEEEKYGQHARRTLTKINVLKDLVNKLNKKGFSIEIQ